MMEELSRLPGLGPSRVRALEKAGVRTLRDLVSRLPVAYRDLTAPTPLRGAYPGLECTVAARVVGEPTEQFAPRLRITRARIADESGDAVAIWYNQPWLKKQLYPGRELLLYGRFALRRGELQLQSPTIEQERAIVPVYRAITGVPPRAMREAVRAALEMGPRPVAGRTARGPSAALRPLRAQFRPLQRPFSPQPRIARRRAAAHRL